MNKTPYETVDNRLTTDSIIELKKLKTHQNGYKSWGKVNVITMGVRLNNNQWQSVNFGADGFNIEAIARSASDSLGKIFTKRRKINIILITEQENAAKVDSTIPAILDDQAQLLGPSLRYVKNIHPYKNIVSALSGRFAANLGNGETICIGKNVEEAYIAAQLVEKTSKAFLEAKHLGGAKSINKLEAWAMHKFFMLKYSKETEKNR